MGKSPDQGAPAGALAIRRPGRIVPAPALSSYCVLAFWISALAVSSMAWPW